MSRVGTLVAGLLLLWPALALPTVPEGGETRCSFADPLLDGLYERLRPTLEANRKSFPGRTGMVRGFGAGAIYPQIWLRDSATVIPLARYYYEGSDLTSWIEEHLSHQAPDGAVYDWIAPGEPHHFQAYAPQAREAFRGQSVVISADRNTTASDQESSLVDAAHQVFMLTGDDEWLLKDIAGRPLIDRLDAAMSSLLRTALDSRYGLITTAFTIDWGDVSPAYEDQRAIYRDTATPFVVSLYASVLFARASEELAVLERSAGREDRARHWSQTAVAVRTAINQHLWQEGTGFYRLHRVVSTSTQATSLDDADLFALGGNGLAAVYGIADLAQAERIFRTAEERKERFGISTVAAVLLPPYPQGFFRHPILREEYSYQNGGQWDWWAGRFVLAEFRRGSAEKARQHLQEIAGRVVGSRGLHEWYTRDGQGKGSATYAGSAGALGAALFEGLLGIELAADGLGLRIRLAGQPADVVVREPATSRFVRYRYGLSSEAARITLAFESNAPGLGTLAVLLPPGCKAAGVRIDGALRSFEVETIGGDHYVVVSTDWGPHTLELTISRAQRLGAAGMLGASIVAALAAGAATWAVRRRIRLRGRN